MTDDTIQAILRLSAEGNTQPQIAAIVHQTPHVVRTVLRVSRPLQRCIKPQRQRDAGRLPQTYCLYETYW